MHALCVTARQAQTAAHSMATIVYTLGSKILGPVICFAKLVQAKFWSVCEEQHAQWILFLTHTIHERNKCKVHIGHTFCKISTIDLSYVVTVKPTVEISQNSQNI